MNVLCDRHHAGLYRSLQLLADRLDWWLLTPYGHDWWDEGYWQFGASTYDDDRLARQFLEPAAVPFPYRRKDSEYWRSEDEEFPGAGVMGVTLAEARRRPWDIVIATVPDNQQGFARFAAEHGARYAVQCGNTGQYIDWSLDPVVLNSSEMPLLGRGVTYHQEIDSVFLSQRTEVTGTWSTANGFDFVPDVRERGPGDPHVVRSFVHLMNETHAFRIWEDMRYLLSAYVFERYGHAPPEPWDETYLGNAKPIDRIAALMATAGWGFHDKPVGDGFGHVIHGWAAVGRPLIGHGSHYRGKLGEVFWRDLETCIDLDCHPLDEAIQLVRDITGSPSRHAEMCRAIAAEYDRIDYAAEAEQIRELLT